MASIFTKIVNGELPSYKVAEDHKHLAFLDIRPLKLGHTLVIPKREQDYVFDLEETEFAELSAFAHKVAKAIRKSVPCSRVGVVVLGMEVPHAHIHLIPIFKESDIRFDNPALNLSEGEFKEVAQRIASNMHF